MYCISESSTRVVVGCFSFVMLCEKGTNDSLVHFASPPPFTLYFGGPRSSTTFLGRNLSLSLELCRYVLSTYYTGVFTHTQGLNPQFLVGQTISNSIYHTFNLSALFALLTHQVLQILANNILSTR